MELTATWLYQLASRTLRAETAEPSTCELLLSTVIQKKIFFFFAVCKIPVEGSLNKQQNKNWSGHVGQIKF